MPNKAQLTLKEYYKRIYRANLRKKKRTWTKEEERITQALANWFCERWSTWYCESVEPEWTRADDITDLLRKMQGQKLTAKNVAATLQKIAKLDLS